VNFLQYLVNGVSEGAIIALIGLGLTLTFGIARFANVAHGDYVTVGAYATLLFNQILGLNLILSIALAIPIGILVGLFVHQTVFKPLSSRSFIASVIASIGVALVIRHVIILVAGTRQYTFDLPLVRAMRFGDVRVAPTDLWIVGTTIVLVLGVHLLLNHTSLGRHMRAVADDPHLARVAGINPQRVISTMWVIALTLAVIAGALFGIKAIIHPYIGWYMLIGAFAAIILGGIGNPYGAVAGALLIGVTQEFSTLFLPPTYKLAVSFVILTIVLLFRPEGLFGERRLVR
jgi:neutral amino acid transport system permease protein